MAEKGDAKADTVGKGHSEMPPNNSPITETPTGCGAVTMAPRWNRPGEWEAVVTKAAGRWRGARAASGARRQRVGAVVLQASEAATLASTGGLVK